MIRRTDSRARRAVRFAPGVHGLEARLVLSAMAGMGDRLASPVAAVATALNAPRRPAPFTALFQGTYATGRARQPGFASQLYMTGGGNTSAFYHANIQVAIYQPDDPSLPAVGRANLIPKGQGAAGNVCLLDLEAVPGHVDKGGRPNLFSWKLNSGSGGQFTDSEGEGTLQLFYFPSRTPPRGALAGGRLGVAIRGVLGTNGVSAIVF